MLRYMASSMFWVAMMVPSLKMYSSMESVVFSGIPSVVGIHSGIADIDSAFAPFTLMR